MRRRSVGGRSARSSTPWPTGEQPVHANRVLAYLKAFFGWAVGRGYLEANPAAGISKPTREVARDRTPSLAEVGEIWNAAGELGYPFGPAIRLLVLTASRRDEVGSIRVDELLVGLDARRGLAGRCPPAGPRTAAPSGCRLCPPHGGSLEEALSSPAAIAEGPFVFSTTGEATPISAGWSRAKGRLDAIIAARQPRRRCVSVDMAAWRIHDLRRAFATAACDRLQIDPAIADRWLNHVGASTTSVISRVYARSELYDQRRDALAQWARAAGAALLSRELLNPIGDDI